MQVERRVRRNLVVGATTRKLERRLRGAERVGSWTILTPLIFTPGTKEHVDGTGRLRNQIVGIRLRPDDRNTQRYVASYVRRPFLVLVHVRLQIPLPRLVRRNDPDI